MLETKYPDGLLLFAKINAKFDIKRNRKNFAKFSSNNKKNIRRKMYLMRFFEIKEHSTF